MTKTIFRATLNDIKEIDNPHRISEHVDSSVWEAYGETAERAKSLLLGALAKRREGARELLRVANERIEQVEKLEA